MNDSSNGHRDYLLMQQKQIVDICRMILSEKVGMVEGVRQIVRLDPRLVDELGNEDLRALAKIEAVTDDVLVGDQRRYYDEKFLADQDRVTKEYEARVKEQVFTACRNLIEGFSASQNS